MATQETEAVVEGVGTVKVIETRPAELPQSLAIIDLLDGSANAAITLEKRAQVRAHILKIALNMTSPSQWQKFSGNGKTTLYPMGGAADTILRSVFGCTWGDKRVTLTRDESGGAIHAKANAVLYQGGRATEEFEGHRDMGGFVNTEADLIKGAFENMKSCAVRDLLGLRGRSAEEIKAMGLDVDAIKTDVTFRDNKAGAGDVPTFRFGRCKDKAYNDPSVSAQDLAWYLKMSDESIASDDPKKIKYRKSEEKNNAALRAEIKRRETPAAPPKLNEADQVIADQFAIRFQEEAQTEETLGKIGADVKNQSEAIRVALKPVYEKRLAEIRAAAKKPAEKGEREPGQD